MYAERYPLVRAGETLRVLMVIARPKGEEDAGYRSIARPLFEKIRAVAAVSFM